MIARTVFLFFFCMEAVRPEVCGSARVPCEYLGNGGPDALRHLEASGWPQGLVVSV